MAWQMWAVLLLGLVAVSMAGDVSSAGAASGGDAPATPSLQLTLAVPIHQGKRSILFGESPPTVHVVLANRSAESVKLWTQQCSFGYDAVQLEIADDTGRRWTVRRRPQGFRQNAPDVITLEPGDMQVIPLALDSRHWEWGDVAEPAQTADVTVRAVYMSKDEPLARQAGVWTGQVASDAKRCTLTPLKPQP